MAYRELYIYIYGLYMVYVIVTINLAGKDTYMVYISPAKFIRQQSPYSCMNHSSIYPLVN